MLTNIQSNSFLIGANFVATNDSNHKKNAPNIWQDKYAHVKLNDNRARCWPNVLKMFDYPERKRNVSADEGISQEARDLQKNAASVLIN